MKQRKLVIEFVLNSEKFKSKLKSVTNDVEDFAKKTTGSKGGKGKGGIFGNIGQSFGNMIQNKFGNNAVTSNLGPFLSGLKKAAPVIAGIGIASSLMWGSIGAGVKTENTLTSLTVLTKSAEKAKKIYMDVVKFTAETPLMSEQTTFAAKQMLAVGYAIDQVKPMMKAIGDVAAGSGKDFNSLISIMAKNKSSGIIQGEDLNQLVDAGIPIIDEFGKMFGKTGMEIRKMASQGKIGYADLERAMLNMAGKGGVYENMMAKQSKTVDGLWSTIKDNSALIFTFMSGAMETNRPTMWTYLKEIIGDMGDKISTFVDTFKVFFVDVGESLGGTAKLLYNIFDIIVTGIKPALYIVSGVVWVIVKAFNIALRAINYIADVIKRLIVNTHSFFNRIFKITDLITLAGNKIKLIWANSVLYLDLMIHKFEKFMVGSNNPILRAIGKVLFDGKDAQGRDIQQEVEKKRVLSPAEAEDRRQRIEKRAPIVQKMDFNNLSPELYDRKYGEGAYSKMSNVDNSRKSVINNSIVNFHATRNEVNQQALRTVGVGI